MKAFTYKVRLAQCSNYKVHSMNIRYLLVKFCQPSSSLTKFLFSLSLPSVPVEKSVPSRSLRKKWVSLLFCSQRSKETTFHRSVPMSRPQIAWAWIVQSCVAHCAIQSVKPLEDCPVVCAYVQCTITCLFLGYNHPHRSQFSPLPTLSIYSPELGL